MHINSVVPSYQLAILTESPAIFMRDDLSWPGLLNAWNSRIMNSVCIAKISIQASILAGPVVSSGRSNTWGTV